MTANSGPSPVLRVVMYHYVRDLPRSRFPRIKGMLTSDFEVQVDRLRQRYEMTTLAMALAFLQGEHHPTRSLCLLTFDDGLREHFAEVTPILAARNIQGVFGLITGCIDEGRVAAVHKNHFLMAALDFDDYRRQFVEQLRAFPEVSTAVDQALAARTYRWDTPEVAAFKLMLNFTLPEAVKDMVLDRLFASHFGDQRAFAEELYLQWPEALQMQAAGMLLGGHTHRHQALATLSAEEQAADLQRCTHLLHRRLAPQPLWPFTYPYGKRHSFNLHTVAALQDLGYACGLATEVGDNQPGEDLFALRRIDPKDVDGD